MNTLYKMVASVWTNAEAQLIETTLIERQIVLINQLQLAELQPEKYPAILRDMYRREIDLIENLIPGKCLLKAPNNQESETINRMQKTIESLTFQINKLEMINKEKNIWKKRYQELANYKKI